MINQAETPEYARKSPNELLSTDPYCPPVRTTSFDDTPLVVKSSQEFPARGGGLRAPGMRHRTDSHVETGHGVEELY